MLFSSLEFLFLFLPAVLALYYASFRVRRLSNLILLIGSIFFYAYGEPQYIWLLIGSIVINAFFAALLYKMREFKLKHILLWIAIVINLFPLFIFKYYNFVRSAIGVFPVSEIHLPIGISFYTFQAISLLVDLYRAPEKPPGVLKTGLYLSFFPQLIAGPILKYSDVSRQIESRKESFSLLTNGMFRFAIGFSKKILLANTFAAIADKVFNWSSIGADYYPVPATLAWLGSISYSLQIYYDFSGYSDMAIGLGKCFGFLIPENFMFPYSAVSIRDFWSRWHISLTDWFRQYVYIPLGGNRNLSMDKTVRNLLIVWLLTGLWHGANWTFIFWGMYYFCFQLLERLTGFPNNLSSIGLKRAYTLLTVNFGWVLFRTKDLYQAGIYFRNMFCLNYNGFFSSLAYMLIRENFFFFTLGVFFLFPISPKISFANTNAASRAFTAICMVLITWLGISYLINGSYNPFIYFNF